MSGWPLPRLAQFSRSKAPALVTFSAVMCPERQAKKSRVRAVLGRSWRRSRRFFAWRMATATIVIWSSKDCSTRALRVAILLGLIAIGFVPLAGAQSAPRAALSSPASSSSAAPSSPESSRSFTDSMSCSACHSTTSWQAKGASGDKQRFDHSKTGFPLTGQHVSTPCVGCHNATRAIKRACASCHEDVTRPPAGS